MVSGVQAQDHWKQDTAPDLVAVPVEDEGHVHDRSAGWRAVGCAAVPDAYVKDYSRSPAMGPPW